MTITDTRPEQTSPVNEDTMRRELEALAADPPYQPGEIAPGEPTYLIPDNPWLPWVTRSGLSALGSCAATITTIMLGSPYAWWALATTVASALLFAFLLAGHELFEKRPTKFKKAQ